MLHQINYSLIACILLAYELQTDAALYVSTDAAGTYIGQLLVLLNTLLPNVGGVVASTVMDVKLLHPPKAV